MTRTITPERFSTASSPVAHNYWQDISETTKLFVNACREGLAAQHRYEALRARNIPHARAIVEALSMHDGAPNSNK